MPNLKCNPIGAIMSGFDASQWAGEQLFSVGGAAVYAPASWDAPFIDAVDFLTHGGMPSGAHAPTTAVQSFQLARVAIGGGFNGVIVDDVDPLAPSSDKVAFFHPTQSFSLVFSTLEDALHFGFTDLITPSQPIGGGHAVTAPLDWVREPAAITNIAVVLDTVPETTVQLFNTDGGTLHSVPEMFTAWSSPRCLSSVDARVRFTLDRHGNVVCAYSVGFEPTPSADFWRWLGFTLDEMPVLISAGMYTLTATHPCPGVLVPTRPFTSIARGEVWRGDAHELTDGSSSVAYMATREQWQVEAWLDGPGSRRDLEAHFLRRVKPWLYPGARVSVYQDWGDTRRAVSSWPWPASGAYHRDYTTQDFGRYGVLRARLAVDAPKAYMAEWSSRSRQMAPLSLTLVSAED